MRHMISEAIQRGSQVALARPPLVMMYSHDGFGLGHMRRNVNIASDFLGDVPGACALLVVSSPTGVFFDLPEGVDFVKLPSVIKVGTNAWKPRNLGGFPEKTQALRTNLIRRAAELFAPDFFLVDHMPTGVWDELLPTLKMFREMASPPKVVLGLRDILDDPEVVRRAWQRDGIYDVIRQYYDEIFIYGDSAVYDTVAHYELNKAWPIKTRYCGYVCAKKPRIPSAEMRGILKVKRDRLMVVTAGGGNDAYPMMDATMKALHRIDADDRPHTVVITGPLMKAEQRSSLERLSQGLPAQVMSSVSDCLSYINAADLVVTMGGYNSLVETVHLEKQTLVIPRSGPSAEQMIRSKILSDMGLATLIEPKDATPERVASEITKALGRQSPISTLQPRKGANTVNGHATPAIGSPWLSARPVRDIQNAKAV